MKPMFGNYEINGLGLEPQDKTTESSCPAGIYIQKMHSGEIILAQFATDGPVTSSINCFINCICCDTIPIILIKKMRDHKSCLPYNFVIPGFATICSFE